MEPCLFCRSEIAFRKNGLSSDVKCPRCGNYTVTSTAIRKIRGEQFTKRQAANISGWLRENQGFFIGADNLNSLKGIPTPSFHERADKLLLNLEALTTYAGETLELNNSCLSMAWALNQNEFIEFLNYLYSVKYLVDIGSTIGNNRVKIVSGGWAYLDRIKKVNQQSTQGFVAMWFSKDMYNVYEQAISVGILNAGYLPHRVDLGEFSDKIDDEIIAQIRRSRFVLADFTGHRGGVYYEAGFAKGLGLEVIWTCREDALDELHFDIRQYNCITWSQDKHTDFSKKITNRIEAVLGQGSYKHSAN